MNLGKRSLCTEKKNIISFFRECQKHKELNNKNEVERESFTYFAFFPLIARIVRLKVSSDLQ